MVSLPSIFIPVWEKACRLLGARRTYSSALCVMDGDCALIGGCICDFFMTSPQLHCRGPRPLTSPGLVHILATPSPPIVWGWPYSPTLFRPTDHATCRTDPLPQSHRLYLSISTCWMWTDNLTLFGPKTSSCLHNPKHLRRNSLCRYCTFHRKPDFPPSLPCFFSAGLTGYLLLLPQRLNRGERAFCGIGAICIAN